MSGCDGCYTSPKGQMIELENAIKAATEYAKEKQVPIAIYKEAGEYKFCNVYHAIEQHLPYDRVVSFHCEITP